MADELWQRMEADREAFRASQRVSGRATRKYLRTLRKPDHRLRIALALLIAVPLYIILATGCATARGVPDYDGDLIPQSGVTDSVTLVPVRIENSRSTPTEVSDPPMFYLLGNGKHQLARVEGLSSRTVFVDSKWLTSADGQITIVVHYTGGSDLTYTRFAWHPGQTIGVSLETHFNPISAWSR